MNMHALRMKDDRGAVDVHGVILSKINQGDMYGAILSHTFITAFDLSSYFGCMRWIISPYQSLATFHSILIKCLSTQRFLVIDFAYNTLELGISRSLYDPCLSSLSTSSQVSL